MFRALFEVFYARTETIEIGRKNGRENGSLENRFERKICTQYVARTEGTIP